jgi:hypothetical protein
MRPADQELPLDYIQPFSLIGIGRTTEATAGKTWEWVGLPMAEVLDACCHVVPHQRWCGQNSRRCR